MTSGDVGTNGGATGPRAAVGEVWAPSACTLPTAERPVRVAEFDEVFAGALLAQRRLGPTRLRWLLDPAVEAAARDLATRESACCSFFTFTFVAPDAGSGEGLVVEVEVPAGQVEVLSALAGRAAAGISVAGASGARPVAGSSVAERSA
jgi:hypothetical protein